MEVFDEDNDIQSCALEQQKIQENNATVDLKLWALKHNISHLAFNNLLKILKTSNNHFENLPSDARSIPSTPRSISYNNVIPGMYSHIGISVAVSSVCGSDRYDKIELLVNVDGLPLSKSSGSQLYPILCSLYGKPRCVAVIGVYHGYEKPQSANTFLHRFVTEVIDLATNGIVVNDAQIPFSFYL